MESKWKALERLDIDELLFFFLVLSMGKVPIKIKGRSCDNLEGFGTQIS